MILSDIPVHREQAPARATYVTPTDVAALGSALWEAWQRYDVAEDGYWRMKAQAIIEQRRVIFGHRFQEILKETVLEAENSLDG
jgi:hypothetical protein